MNSYCLVTREGRPEVLIDVSGVVGQFLTDLTAFDVVVEFIQNELDAGSTKTKITFGSEALICEGNGKTIDATGWDRLRYVLGAGGDVAPKVGGIGAKNHGLRSAFLLGDNIIVQSDGHRIDLTVRGAETNPSKFFPAVWPKIADPAAPKTGTRITVPYRKTPLIVPNGDQTGLDVETPEKIAALFTEAVVNSPSRFIAASAPGRSWRYELTFAFGDTVSKFVFECELLKGKFAGLFRRTCRLQEAGRRSSFVLRQLGTAFDLKLTDEDRAKVPKLFQRGTRLLGEISWHVDRNDTPLMGCGALRYPIGYPIENVRSGYGFDISGPFISGRARHSLSGDARNNLICKVGCTAFVDIIRKKLIPLFGAKSLDLVSSLNFPDADAEKRLINDLLNAGALPIAKTVSRSKRGIFKPEMMDVSSSLKVIIANLSYEPSRVAANLVRLAVSAPNLLHPDVHDSVTSTLQHMRKDGDARVAIFDEFAAARTILIEQTPSEKQDATIDWIEDVISVLSELESSRHRKPLPADFVQKLKTEGRLPSESGTASSWAHIRRSTKLVPAIPGIVDPEILHPRLLKLNLLKEGPLKIPKFNLDEFVSNKDFSKASTDSRQRFFMWLRKSHSDLNPRALAKIASYPIWPGVDGEHRTLDDYCWPKSLDLRNLVHSANIAPASEVVSFPGLRRSHNGALRLRVKPTEDELRIWYVIQTDIIYEFVEADKSQDAIKEVFKLEKALDWLRQLDEYDIKGIAKGHNTFTRSGDYKSVADIHCPTREVEHCGLLDVDVAGGIFIGLYVLLGSYQKPIKAALVRVLVSDTNQLLLYNRLETYKSLGYGLSDLSGEPIIVVRGQAMAPDKLTFPSKTNFWGEWKTTLENFSDIPDRVALLEGVGVVRQALREELSCNFFDWLSKQNKARQMRHLPQIIRHWGDRRHGPLRWVKNNPTIPCIPVRGSKVDFDLLSYERAASVRANIFLPDFREIQEKLIVDNTSTRLIITSVKGVVDSVLDVMDEAGLQSLRMKAGRPIQILTSDGVEHEPKLDAVFRLVQSKDVMKRLTQLLPEFNVPVSSLRRDWKRRLEALKGVRITGRLRALFAVLNCKYEIEAIGGVDEPSQLLCIDRKADPKLAFYAALAEHLFAENGNPLWAYGLRLAIESSHEPTFVDFNADLDEDPEGDENSDQDEDKGEPKEAEPPRPGHGISKAKMEPIVPKPNPLGDISDETKMSGKKQPQFKGTRAPSSTDHRRNSIEEEEQKLELKQNHYAWHCQACLGRYDAIKAAPSQSYVYLPSIRRRLIEAHHVDHLQNKGVIGAKNLIVLCTFHHDYLGDRLSSMAIKGALATAKRVTRTFPSNAEGTTFNKLEGWLAEIIIDSEVDKLPLFFTDQHAEAWVRLNKRY
jgi:hypothetical protein